MKINQTGGHLDQMLRQTRAHHVQLSTMADNKANALMTIAAVITTFSASFLDRPGFKLPVILLMCFNFVAILLATVTVMPNLGFWRKPRKSDPAPPHGANILFFGTFAGMSYQQFETAMEEMMNDASKTYEMQVREIYILGCFLAAKKYRSLKHAYIVFLVGIFCSGATLVISQI